MSAAKNRFTIMLAPKRHHGVRTWTVWDETDISIMGTFRRKQDAQRHAAKCEAAAKGATP